MVFTKTSVANSHRFAISPDEAANSSSPSLATNMHPVDLTQQDDDRTRSSRRDSRAEIKYTYSFRRSEHAYPQHMPPPYALTPKDGFDTLSYSFSYSRRHSRSSPLLITPLDAKERWIPLHNSERRTRAKSTLIFPIVSPISATEPTHDERSPVLELPSPFSSPLFYWSGRSCQERSEAELTRQVQIDDLESMSPYGSPSFYWNGVSRQVATKESTRQKTKKVVGKLGMHIPHIIRPVVLKDDSVSKGPVWDERRQAYILVDAAQEH